MDGPDGAGRMEGISMELSVCLECWTDAALHEGHDYQITASPPEYPEHCDRCGQRECMLLTIEENQEQD